jgi:hypothetical protein
LANQIGRQCRQVISVTFRRAVFDRYVPTLGIASLIARYWAPPAQIRTGGFPAYGSYHAAAAPPSSVMNSRRFMLSMGDFLPYALLARQPCVRFSGTSACHSEASKSLGQT